MKFFVILFFVVFLFLGCSRKHVHLDESFHPDVSKKQAIEIASKLIKSKIGLDEIILDSVEVYEQASVVQCWAVAFKKSDWKTVRPSIILVYVDKTTGNAIFKPLR